MSVAENQPLPGQFRLRALFALMTLAAVAAWIMSLSIRVHTKMALLVMLWLVFQFWQMLAWKRPLSPRDRLNHGITSIIGQLLMFGMLTSGSVVQVPWPWNLIAFMTLVGLAALGPAIGIWHAVRQIRQALAESRAEPASPANT